METEEAEKKPVDELAILRRVSGEVEDLDPEIRKTVLDLARSLSVLDPEASSEAFNAVKKTLQHLAKLPQEARTRVIDYTANRFTTA